MRRLIDSFGRVHDYLRISLTDRCNLNCIYCNPAYSRAKYVEKEDLLSFEQILRLVRIFSGRLGFKKFRLTGGEPLARKNVIGFLKELNVLKFNFKFETAITTNGTLLYEKLDDMKKCGVDKINISLDSLRPDKFRTITGRDNHAGVMNAICRAKEAGYDNLKINCVVMKGINDSEILDFVEFAIREELNVRFIEYMPFSNNRWNENDFYGYKDIMKRILEKYELIPVATSSSSVSKDYLIKNNSGMISFISSITHNFCTSCSRIRITAKGNLRLCLFSSLSNELALKPLLSNSRIDDNEISAAISGFVLQKPKEHPHINELVKQDLNYMLTNGG